MSDTVEINVMNADKTERNGFLFPVRNGIWAAPMSWNYVILSSNSISIPSGNQPKQNQFWNNTKKSAFTTHTKNSKFERWQKLKQKKIPKRFEDWRLPKARIQELFVQQYCLSFSMGMERKFCVFVLFTLSPWVRFKLFNHSEKCSIALFFSLAAWRKSYKNIDDQGKKSTTE